MSPKTFASHVSLWENICRGSEINLKTRIIWTRHTIELNTAITVIDKQNKK
jgi:hypothetical protein